MRKNYLNISGKIESNKLAALEGIKKRYSRMALINLIKIIHIASPSMNTVMSIF